MITLYTSSIIFLTVLLLIATVLPLIRNDFWVYRVFEFPRFQKWWISILLFLLTITSLYYRQDSMMVGNLIVLSIIFSYLSYRIYPFTPLAPKQLANNKNKNLGRIRVVVSNVYQYNRKGEKLVKSLSKYEADIMVFVETDQWWKDVLDDAFGQELPYHIHRPTDNTYGMLLYSRHRLSEQEVRYVVKTEIPSMRTLVHHPSGDIRLYAIHPEPPVPSENPQSTERDAELLRAAYEARLEEIPTIVAGDLNDVAWSYTTERFVEVSGLKDPRRGRGMHSTFNAKYPGILRWPLDHIFCSEHFTLNRMVSMRHVGSDHLPIYADFAFKEPS